MKQCAFALVTLFVLIALGAVPLPVAHAAADATCASDPAVGPVGTEFVITCSGFTPNSYAYGYLVEPGGAAGQLFSQSGALKVDANGALSYTQLSKFGNEAALATGTWHFVAEELGLAKSVKHRGETSFTITGGIEGVSGARLSAEPTMVHKPTKGFVHFRVGGSTYNFLDFSDPVTVSGSGFAPNEFVTFWAEPPNGGCPSFTLHEAFDAGSIVPGVIALYQKAELNFPQYDGLGAQILANVQADADGAATVQAYFTATACEGNWRIVARGMGSGSGGETGLTVVGNAVETNAYLSADPGSVTAMFDRVRFHGSGFGATEHVSCWLTSPQGRTLGYPHDFFVTFSFADQFLRNQSILSDTEGNVSFEMVTGSVFFHEQDTLSIGGVVDSAEFTFLEAAASEGALGEYAMSCRGDVSGAIAIARFVVTGGAVDP